MNKSVKLKWKKALISGEYKQGKEVLKQLDNSFCCLGVLCDIHSKETDTSWDENAYGATYRNESIELPPEVVEWAGIDFDIQEKLIDMNDIQDKSFIDIAYYIDKNL